MRRRELNSSKEKPERRGKTEERNGNPTTSSKPSLLDWAILLLCVCVCYLELALSTDN